MAKSIVVFSDGTSNSSAKVFKTNVWRLYKALDELVPSDPSHRRQFTYYDDGVGSSSLKPLALLGGIFGWGLKRNVLDLYRFICRNYEKGDKIYAFGFSRGAFTIRILIALIAKEGLVPFSGEANLDSYSRQAYRAYRRSSEPTKLSESPNLIARGLRRVRNFIFQDTHSWTKKKPDGSAPKPYKDIDMIDVGDDTIEFVGVWDTVSAYGMPLSEMTRGFDRWIWPLSMPNYILSPKVARARHALALDDERDTFHPLLWDEFKTEKSERLEQVWFAGMHSDVGGGYPDDGMAHVPLAWMIEHAEVAGLRFEKNARNDIMSAAREAGPMHDSRSGFGGYYRYQPRKISAWAEPIDRATLVMRDPELENGTDKPKAFLRDVKIHESVVKRLETGPYPYAPIVLPEKYTVVGSPQASPVRQRANPVQQQAALAHQQATPAQPHAAPTQLPPASQATNRINHQDRIWDKVWLRRINYFALVAVSLGLLFLPLFQYLWPDLGIWSRCAGPECPLYPATTTTSFILPDFLQPWIRAFTQAPMWVVISAIIIIMLRTRSTKLKTSIHDDMTNVWKTKYGVNPSLPLKGWKATLRSNEAYMKFFRTMKWYVVPHILGFLMFWVAVVLIIGVIYIILMVFIMPAHRFLLNLI